MGIQNENVILVNEQDEPTGVMEKQKVHELGVLHRAFSVLLFNDANELLLQQRAHSKYHCGGLWTNTCCSHPRPDEDVADAAKRRLKEEMGIECELKKSFEFIYTAHFNNGLTEHEYDHVFMGKFSGTPIVNTAEVSDWKYISLERLQKDMVHNPDDYTPWFKIIIEKLNP